MLTEPCPYQLLGTNHFLWFSYILATILTLWRFYSNCPHLGSCFLLGLGLTCPLIPSIRKSPHVIHKTHQDQDPPCLWPPLLPHLHWFPNLFYSSLIGFCAVGLCRQRLLLPHKVVTHCLNSLRSLLKCPLTKRLSLPALYTMARSRSPLTIL